MKEGIHPKYYSNAKVTCACGNTFETGSTKPELRVEICSKCRSLQANIRARGRIRLFNKRYGKKLVNKQYKCAAEQKCSALFVVIGNGELCLF